MIPRKMVYMNARCSYLKIVVNLKSGLEMEQSEQMGWGEDGMEWGTDMVDIEWRWGGGATCRQKSRGRPSHEEFKRAYGSWPLGFSALERVGDGKRFTSIGLG